MNREQEWAGVLMKYPEFDNAFAKAYFEYWRQVESLQAIEERMVAAYRGPTYLDLNDAITGAMKKCEVVR